MSVGPVELPTIVGALKQELNQLSMIATDQYNNLTPSFVPKMKPDEVAIYVLTGDPTRMKGGRIMYQAKDVISDPEKGAVEIAYVIAKAPQGKLPQIGNIEFLREEKGVITLSGAIPSHLNLFQHMELCNGNGSNPNRDTTKEIIFYRKDAGYKEISMLERAKLDAEAFEYASKAPVDELRRVLAEDRKVNVKNMTETGLRAKALEEGKKRPLVAAAPATNPANAELRGKIAEAFDAEIIKFSVADKMLFNTQNTDVKYPVAGLLQTDPKEKKIEKLYQAALKDQALSDALIML